MNASDQQRRAQKKVPPERRTQEVEAAKEPLPERERSRGEKVDEGEDAQAEKPETD